MNELAKALAESARKGQHAQLVSLYSDLLTATYDKATAYLNVVTLGGYAAFFGLWSLVGGEIAPTLKFWSALLLGISVLLFVGFEVFKAALLHWQIRGMMKLARTPLQRRCRP
ncbi:MAG: hypothetical protein JNL45_14785 [Hyphomicrobium sp.]|jgi:hypothetical protein|nr:hypothetical protein [Hyphomicrobium sp.]